MNLEKALKQARISNEIEGKQIELKYTELIKSRLTNEISEEDFQQKVKELIKK